MKKILKMTLIVVFSLIGIVVLIGVVFINVSPEFGGTIKGDRKKLVEASSHYQDGKFQNIEDTEVMKEMDYSTIPKYFTKGDMVPDWSIPVVKLRDDYFDTTPDATTRVTWFGHSALLLEMDGKKIFLDPMLGNVPAPHPWLGTSRFNDTLPMAIDKLPMLDAVIISHDHYDHLDYGSIKKIKDKTSRFYAPLGVGAHLEAWGVAPEKITELDWWQETMLDNIKLVATPSRHFSGRGVTDRAKTLWSSWAIIGSNDKVFFGGDSGYDNSFKKIGEKYGPFDLATLECGQYNKQWPEIHMMPEETVQAGIDVRADVVMPIHWGAFKLALHPWEEPVQRCLDEADKLGVKVTTPKIGESIILKDQYPNSKWWVK